MNDDDQLLERLESLEVSIRAVILRIEDLEQKGRPARRADDELTLKIFEMLKGSPHLKFNAVSAAESLDADNKLVHTRLMRLSVQGRILRLQREGKQAVFQYKDDPFGEDKG